MSNNHVVMLALDDDRFALSLDEVETIVRSCQITSCPDLPSVVSGLINFRGHIIPVVNMRKRLNLPLKNLRLSDQFVIVNCKSTKIALWVDEVVDVTEIDEEKQTVFQSSVTGPGVKHCISTESGVILVHEIETLLPELMNLHKLDELNKTSQQKLRTA